MTKQNATTYRDYVDIEDYETAIAIIPNDDFSYIFFKIFNVLKIDDSYELLSQICNYSEKWYSSDKIAEFGNNLFETATDHFDDDIDDCGTFNELYDKWIERLFLLAIKKVESEKDELYIKELLLFQDKTIEYYKNLDYIVAHKYTINNRQYIQKSKLCGCCHCMTQFTSDKVTEYIGDTAICPNCPVDAVVCDAIVDINEKLLYDMNRRWF